MGRITPLAEEDLPAELREAFAAGEQMMGFKGEDGRVMARRPAILAALGQMVRAVYAEDGLVPLGLKRLVGIVASSAAGCQYCTAHVAHGAHRIGVPEEKVAAVWEFETSPLFDAAERAALRFAQGAAQAPSAVSDADFAELRRHWSEDAVVELMGVIALFGFLNRWNDGLATTLEDVPRDFAQRVLPQDRWRLGKHA